MLLITISIFCNTIKLELKLYKLKNFNNPQKHLVDIKLLKSSLIHELKQLEIYKIKNKNYPNIQTNELTKTNLGNNLNK